MPLYEVKAFRLLTTYEKEWYKVEANSPEEAKKLVENGEGEYDDGKSVSVEDGEFTDMDQWEVKEVEK